MLDFGVHRGVLTPYCKPDAYGAEIDEASITAARANHPDYTFVTELPEGEEVRPGGRVALIEHIHYPRAHRRSGPRRSLGGKIVLTTPHPKFEWIHTVGAKVGLFNNDAHYDHEDLIDKALMTKLAAPSGLVIKEYRRFMFGANQLFVLGLRTGLRSPRPRWVSERRRAPAPGRRWRPNRAPVLGDADGELLSELATGCAQCLGEHVGIPGRHQHPGPAVDHHLVQPGDVRGDHRNVVVVGQRGDRTRRGSDRGQHDEVGSGEVLGRFGVVDVLQAVDVLAIGVRAQQLDGTPQCSPMTVR